MKLLTWIGWLLIFQWGTGYTLIDATSREWAGGLQESGYGTDYTVSLRTKTSSEHLTIDQLWIGDIRFDVRAVKELSDRRTTEFGKRDTLFVHAGLKYVSTDLGETKRTSGELTTPPRSYQGAGLIGYLHKGKRKYKVIRDFRILEKIIYP